ncbi:MAG: translation initiation factor IF-2 N-terminal domain-containing protein, partial [Pseudonocardiaceae bacterium]
MANTTTPAGSVGGRTGTSTTSGPAGVELAASLPDRLRVHALAKLLSVSSKEVMAALSELGIATRSPQSSIDRETALRAVQVLLPDPEPDAGDTDQIDLRAGEVEDRAAPGVPLARVFNAAAPVFLPPVSTPPVAEEPEESDEQGEDEAEADGAGRRRRRRGRRGRGR